MPLLLLTQLQQHHHHFLVQACLYIERIVMPMICLGEDDNSVLATATLFIRCVSCCRDPACLQLDSLNLLHVGWWHWCQKVDISAFRQQQLSGLIACRLVD